VILLEQTLNNSNQTIKKHQEIIEILTQSLQDSENTSQELKQNLATLQATTSTATFKEPKINQPEPFSGDRAKTRSFLVQVELVFLSHASRFLNDRSKTLYVGSFLRGPAASWFSPLL
jgi:hypothetical protein